MQNYVFYFEDNTFLTFSLTEEDFNRVKEVFVSDRPHVVLQETIISKKNIRYITKHVPQEEGESAVPEYLDQQTYEYLKTLERGE